MRRVDLEIDGLSVDTLVCASNTRGLVLDLALDITEVCELPARDMVKLSPFGASRSMRRFVRVGGRIGGVLVFGNVDELEDEGATSDDTAAAREEVPANDVLEDRGLAGGLRANDDLINASVRLDDTISREMSGAHNLGEVEGVAADGVEDQVLQLVDSGEQILAERSHGYRATRLSESEAFWKMGVIGCWKGG
jgi:hypothetical protein